MKKKRNRRYKPRSEEIKPPTTPQCGCGLTTELSRTSPGGMYFTCDNGHERFVMLGDISALMSRQWAKDGADLPEARREEYYKGRDVAARELANSMETIGRLHVPLADL